MPAGRVPCGGMAWLRGSLPWNAPAPLPGRPEKNTRRPVPAAGDAVVPHLSHLSRGSSLFLTLCSHRLALPTIQSNLQVCRAG